MTSEDAGTSDRGLGWRGKIGLILPSVQTVTEPLFNRSAPAGVAFFAARTLVKQSVLADHREMEEESFRAGRALATAGVDCIASCCTASGILRGRAGDREFCRRMAAETGVPTVSAVSAVLAALEASGVRRLVLLSPYGHEMHALEEAFLRANGFEIVRSHSLGLDAGRKFAEVPPGRIYRLCREQWDERADGLLVSCMNFNAAPVLDALEEDLGRPALSSHSATLWKALRAVGVRGEVPGFGRLLRGE